MTRIAGATILVTGAGGFVGRHLVRLLDGASARVHGAGLEARPSGLPLEGWHALDLCLAESVDAAIAASRPDVIVHLAGQASAGRSFQDPAETFEVNALGTWWLLEAARRHAPRSRVLVIGTGDAYGSQPEGSRVSEETPLRPVSPYALSKAAADAFADLAARRGLDVVRTRSFAHYGPGQAPTFVVPSWARQIATIEAGRADPVLKVGNLEVTRDVSDVRDVVAAYRALIERGRAGAVYNVCRGAGVQLSEVARLLVGASRTAVRIEEDPGRFRPADIGYLVGDPSAFYRDTGLGPEIPLERTLSDVLEEARRIEREQGGGPA